MLAAATMLTAGVAAMGEDAGVWLPSIFSENLVLQRDMPVPIWGRARPGATVTTTVYDGGRKLSTAESVAAADGRWRNVLPAMPAGGRYALLVEAKGASEAETSRRLYSNVLVGEVWLFCGQSNMMHPMNACAERDDAVARRGEFPLIRFAQIGSRTTQETTRPQEETAGFWGPVKWEDATYLVPRSSASDIPGSCSAIGYFFARSLTERLGGNVPVAVIEVGAILPVQSWVDEETLAGVPELASLAGRPYPDASSRGFAANVAPLAPYACRGVMYYQGEMNGGAGWTYYHGLKALIASWRKAWANPELPFLITQLPGFVRHEAGKTALDMDAASLAKYDGENRKHGYIPIREAQLRVSRDVPRVGLAVSLDQGDRFDIHPARKRTVGERLALQAARLAYGDASVVAEGPVPRSFDRIGDKFAVRFDGGLVARGDLAGFEVADAAGDWHPAEARIDGDAVLVRSAAAAEPTGVRYAWLGFPPVALFNDAGLPASPFCHPAVDLKQMQQGK
jgi:sialate O-acetylesterase